MSAHISDTVKTVRVMNAVAAGTSDQTSSSVDMAGFDAVRFIALFGTLSSSQVTTIKVQQSSDDGSSDAFADIKDSQTDALADTDDNDMVQTDIIRPNERYVKCIVSRATGNAVIDGVIAELYRTKTAPITQDATMIKTVQIFHTEEGTA